MEGSENSYLGGSKAGKTDKNGRILLVPADPVKKPKHQAPQDAIDEFWQNFNTKTPGKGTQKELTRFLHTLIDLRHCSFHGSP